MPRQVGKSTGGRRGRVTPGGRTIKLRSKIKTHAGIRNRHSLQWRGEQLVQKENRRSPRLAAAAARDKAPVVSGGISGTNPTPENACYGRQWAGTPKLAKRKCRGRLQAPSRVLKFR